jgi:two-component system, cell cycle sensor histidine kinase and response regulator CckA
MAVPSLLLHNPARRLVAALTLTLLASLAIGAAMVFVTERSRGVAKRAEARVIATDYTSRLTTRIDRSLSSTYALSAMVRLNHGKPVDFENVATEMLRFYGDISSLQLAPQGVVTYIVPIAGNEQAFGHDLLRDVQRNKEAISALNARKLTLAGPFELVQGGEAIVGRLPILMPDAGGTDKFWGFATAVIQISVLLQEAGITEISGQGYRYELWRIHPDTRKRHVFASSGDGPLSAPVSHEFEVPNGKWILSLEPKEGWISPDRVYVETAIWILVSVLLTLLAYVTLKE